MVAILKLITAPMGLIISFLICGLFLAKGFREKDKYRRAGWYLVLAATLVLFLLSLRPVSSLLVYSLESGYRAASPETLLEVDIIVVLGGGISCSDKFRPRPEASMATYSRLFAGADALRRSKAEVMLLSGDGNGGKAGETNAEIMKGLAIKLGIPENKILLDIKSRNTIEHAIEVAKLFSPKQNKRIGIVTSALHMQRAERCFKKIYGGNIVPIPADYTFTSFNHNIIDFIPSLDAFSMSSQAFHEWVGMVWYAIRYKI